MFNPYRNATAVVVMMTDDRALFFSERQRTFVKSILNPRVLNITRISRDLHAHLPGIYLYFQTVLTIKLAYLFDALLARHYILHSTGQAAFAELAQNFLLYCRLPGVTHMVLRLPSPLRCHSAL